MEHLNFLKNLISNMFKIKSIYQNTVLYRSYIKWLIYIDNKNILNENNKVRGPLIDKYLPKNKKKIIKNTAMVKKIRGRIRPKAIPVFVSK